MKSVLHLICLAALALSCVAWTGKLTQGDSTNANGGLVLHMTFEDVSSTNTGTVIPDLSGYGNYGVITDRFQLPLGISNGVRGQGIHQFSGPGTPSGIIMVTNMAQNLNINTHAGITVMTWLKVDAFGPDARLLVTSNQGVYSTSSNQYALIIGDGSSNPTVCFDSRGLHQCIASPYPLKVGVWYHVAGTDDGVTQTIYVNAVSYPTTGDPSGAVTYQNGPDLWLMLRFDGSKPFLGVIDELWIYNRALSAKEISAIYYSSKPVYGYQ